MEIELVVKFIFYVALIVIFTDLAFYIIEKVIKFAASLVNMKFTFKKLSLKKKDGE